MGQLNPGGAQPRGGLPPPQGGLSPHPREIESKSNLNLDFVLSQRGSIKPRGHNPEGGIYGLHLMQTSN